MKETKKSRADWLGLVRSWEASGQSQRLFCESRGLKVATFGYWRRQYLREQSLCEQAVPSGFVALETQFSEASVVKLRLGGLEVELSAEADFVADVLSKLAGRC